MVKPYFDERGFITPCDKIELELDDFKNLFVTSFPAESTRHDIFVGYLHFLSDFKEQVAPHFTQWIGGSFVTKKDSPNDIDFITLIDYKVYEQKEKLIDQEFRRKGAQEKYGVDAYTLWVYSKNHPKFVLTEFDLIEWHNHWSTTMRNRRGKSFKKGFIELKF